MSGSSRRATGVSLLGLGVAFVGPPALAGLSRAAFGIGTQVAILVASLALAAGVLTLARRAQHIEWHALGASRPTWRTFAIAGVIAAVVRWAWLPGATHLGLDPFRTGLDVVTAWPLWLRVLKAVVQGISEETLYRAYAVETLAGLTGQRWLAGIVVVLASSVAHVPFWGLGPAVAADLPVAIALTVVYLWRRDLVMNAVAHAALMLMPLV